MNVIIPLGGKGERFYTTGFTDPKPLIPIFEKCMIEYVLDSLCLHPDDKVYIIYNERLDAHQFSSRILAKYPFVCLLQIQQETKGAAETILLGIRQIESSGEVFPRKCMILDCDSFYTEDILARFRESSDNMVFYTKNEDPSPIYSYISLDDAEYILDIKEKIKISDNANTGAYAFVDISQLGHFCQHITDRHIMFSGEYYTSCVIMEMLHAGHRFRGCQVSNSHFFSLGTPVSVRNYVERTYAFLFDLDGTIVLTENVYYKVWQEILSNYNIVLSESIFSKCIQGNTDLYVLNSILENTGLSLQKLSEWKDRLFIQNIDQIEMIEGIQDVVSKIRENGHKLCIVTNCNRNAAVAILKHIRLYPYFDFILSSNDFPGGSKSYQSAADKYRIPVDHCIILEDSKTGILCGKQFDPKMLIGIETIYNAEELKCYGVDMSLPNFVNFDIEWILHFQRCPIHKIKDALLASLQSIHIQDIYIHDTKLKGGYIADVVKARVQDHNGQIYHLVVKYESHESQTGLSIMSNRIRMYEREYYFYEYIAPHINIRIPPFYGFVMDSSGNHNGIVLENMFEKAGYRLNLNLNVEPIHVALKVVEQMAKMHSLFWGKSLKIQFPRLYTYSDDVFCPFLSEFVNERRVAFESKWSSILTDTQNSQCSEIFNQYSEIQRKFTQGRHLTFIHGDIKSPNLFYDADNEPVFIDWQHCAIGKGVQDLAFFVLESFDIENVCNVLDVMKSYYYTKIIEYGVEDYSMEEYERDVYDAFRFIPFFTAVWFGTTSEDELIDKHFPYLLITKLFRVLSK
jgi:beta-phosphoglucomutase-like phosphatase (HAD superfamily)/choline kinase